MEKILEWIYKDEKASMSDPVQKLLWHGTICDPTKII